MLGIIVDDVASRGRVRPTDPAQQVLHAVQKKSKSGIKTPTEDSEWVQRRLKAAEADDKIQSEKGKAWRSRS